MTKRSPFRDVKMSPEVVRLAVILYVRFPLSLQKFAAVHSAVHNHINQKRHLYSRNSFKHNRAAALAEWRDLGAG